MSPIQLYRKYQNIDAFAELIQSVRKCFFLDAYIDTQTIDFYRTIYKDVYDWQNDEKMIYNTYYPFADRKCSFYQNGDGIIDLIDEHMEKKEKLAICSTSRGFLEKLIEKHHKKTTLYLTGHDSFIYKNSSLYQKFDAANIVCEDINDIIQRENIEVIMYSPTITAGVSIDEFFPNVIAYHTSSVSSLTFV